MKAKRFLAGVLTAAMLLTMVTLPAAAARTNTLADGLVLYSSFEDATIVTENEKKVVKDQSPNGHDGAVVGDLTFVDSGNGTGKAAEFSSAANGGDDAAANRYISYGKSAEILPATGNFSVSLWYKATSATPGTDAVLYGNKNYKNGSFRGIALGGFSEDFRVNFSATGAVGTAGTRIEMKGADSGAGMLKTARTDQSWHHIVVTYDRSGDMTCYIDNIKIKAVSIAAQKETIDVGLDLALGAGGNGNNGIKNCIVDEFLVYDRLLNTTEIGQLYNKTAPDFTPLGLDEGILLDVDFNDNVSDKSGNNYNGTKTGAGATYVDGPFGDKALKIVNATAASGGANDDATADSYVDFGTGISQNGLADKPFTMSFWYMPDPEMNSYGAIISNKNYKSGGNKGFALGYYGGNDCKMNFTPSSGTKAEIGKIDLHQGGGWHHFTVTVVPGGSMKVYVDGVAVGNAALTSGTIHADLPLILGAGGNTKNPITNVQIDNLRIYNRALDATNVAALYGLDSAAADIANEAIAKQLAIAKGKADLTEAVAYMDTLQPGVTYTQENIAAIKATLTETKAKVEAGNLEDDALLELLDTTLAAYHAFLNGVKPLASFHLVSDVHIPGSSKTDANSLAYVAGMKDMKTLNTETNIAFVNVGDFTDNSTEAEYKGFYELTAENNPVTPKETLILLGNHDVRGSGGGTGNPNWNADPRQPGKCVNWPAAKERYQRFNADYMPAEAQTTLYHSKELGGYTFIMLNTELGLKDAMYMSDAQIAWFEATMKAAYEKDSSKPIFIISHQALNDTHWRSNNLNGFDGVNWDGTGFDYQTGADAKVKEIMAKYPNGVLFSGHIHNGPGVAQVIPREYGITVDVPSYKVADSNNGDRDVGVGYEIYIYDDTVVFRMRNFRTGTWMPEYDVAVPMGRDGYAATAQRAKDVYHNPLWYSETDAAKVTPYMDLLNRYYKQTNNYVEPAPSADKLLYGAATHAKLAEEAPKVDPLLTDITKLDTPRKGRFEVLRENWRSFLLGGTGADLDLNDPAIAAYVDGLNSEANGYWEDLIKSDKTRTDFIFPGLNMDMGKLTGSTPETQKRSGAVGTSFQRLRSLALAWATKGCDLYQNLYVQREIINATDFVVENYYNREKYPTAKSAQGNWYHWDITSTTALGNITMVMYDVLGAARVKRYAESIQWFAPNCQNGGPHSLQTGPMTAGNLLLKGNGVAQAGILLEDEAMLNNVREQVGKTVGTYNDPKDLYSHKDGFYTDGSYIQHGAVPYIAGYGADLYNNFSIFSNTLKGSEWEIKPVGEGTSPIYDTVFSGIEPFIYNTRIMDMVTGRGITRKGYTDRGKTTDLLSAILPLRGTFPTAEENRRFDSMMKYYIGQDPDYYYSRIGNIASIKAANDIMNDTSIQPRSNYALTKTFAMDRTVHITPDFGLGIAMQSSRIYAHERINNEGKRTWNISNGMTFLYDGDEGQFGGGYWATVDPTRLPGTTTEHVIYKDSMGNPDGTSTGDRSANIYDWTGGASLEGTGVAGTHMKAPSKEDYKEHNGADMKKSYFMFGDRILMMGSGITSNTGDGVETIVDNRKLLPDASNVVTVNGTVPELSGENASPSELADTSWLHVTGNVKGADVGYYFPEAATLKALKETRTGDWSSQGTTSGSVTNSFATFWFDHGANPNGASYEYVLLPGKTAAETAAYADHPDVEVLQNDEHIHAARDNRDGVTAANFWDKTGGSIAGVSVDKEASVILRQSGSSMELAVSDPTQRDTVITVSLANTGSVVSKDERVTVLQSEPFLRFSVDTSKGLGGSYTVTLNVKPIAKAELANTMTVIEPLKVAANTEFRALGLPAQAEFAATDGVHTLNVEWSRNGYESAEYGVFAVIGTPVLTGNLSNTAGIHYEIQVVQGTTSTLDGTVAEADGYVEDGESSDTVMSGGTGSTLAVKLDNEKFYRKAVLRFDLSDIPADGNGYILELGASADASFQGGAIYQVGNAWEETTVTWNTLPARVSEEPLTTFHKEDVVGGILTLDVTDAVKAALAAEETAISFVIEATGTKQEKNQMSITSKDASSGNKPTLRWGEAPIRPDADKENLQLLVDIVSKLDAKKFLNYSAEAFSTALAEAKLVLNDAEAAQGEVNDAEDALLLLLLSLRAKPVPRA